MSGANGQPWEFIVVKDPATRKKIVDIYKTQLHAEWNIEKTRIRELRHAHFWDGPPEPMFIDAPVIIVVLGDRRTYQATILSGHFLIHESGPHALYYKNMANATQLLCLAAAALGLGTEWVSVTYPIEAPLKTLLGVPNELQIHTMVPVGYPARDPAPPYRRKLEEIVHYEKYDQSKYRSPEDIFEWLQSMRQLTKPAYDKMRPD